MKKYQFTYGLNKLVTEMYLGCVAHNTVKHDPEEFSFKVDGIENVAKKPNLLTTQAMHIFNMSIYL